MRAELPPASHAGALHEAASEARTLAVIGHCPKNRDQSFEVALYDFKGRVFAEILICNNSPRADGRLHSTGRGMSIPARRLAGVIDLLKAALIEANSINPFNGDN